MVKEKENDKHGTPATTRWVHKHRALAKLVMRGLAFGATAALYYLKNQEKEIAKEEKTGNK